MVEVLSILATATKSNKQVRTSTLNVGATSCLILEEISSHAGEGTMMGVYASEVGTNWHRDGPRRTAAELLKVAHDVGINAMGGEYDVVQGVVGDLMLLRL